MTNGSILFCHFKSLPYAYAEPLALGRVLFAAISNLVWEMKRTAALSALYMLALMTLIGAYSLVPI